MAGNQAHLQTSGTQGLHYEMKKLNTQAKGQQAACDIYISTSFTNIYKGVLLVLNNYKFKPLYDKSISYFKVHHKVVL